MRILLLALLATLACGDEGARPIITVTCTGANPCLCCPPPPGVCALLACPGEWMLDAPPTTGARP